MTVRVFRGAVLQVRVRVTVAILQGPIQQNNNNKRSTITTTIRAAVAFANAATTNTTTVWVRITETILRGTIK